MKNLTIWVTAALLLLSHHALADRQQIDESRQVGANERIQIEVMRGQVTIRTGAPDTFTVSGLLDELAEGFDLSSRNGFTRFEVNMPRNPRISGRNNDRSGSDLQITVPEGSNVEFSGVNVSVDINGVSGGSKIRTVNGPINASELGNYVELSTVNGAIRSRANTGRIDIDTVNGEIDDSASSGRINYTAVNGRINVDSSAGEARLSVVNGRVHARLQETDTLELNSVNGGIDITLLNSTSPRITGNSVSGNITLNLDSNVDASFSLRSNAGGNIRNGLSTDEAVRARYGPSRRLEFSTGQGQGSVDLTTLSGRLELNRN